MRFPRRRPGGPGGKALGHGSVKFPGPLCAASEEWTAGREAGGDDAGADFDCGPEAGGRARGGGGVFGGVEIYWEDGVRGHRTEWGENQEYMPAKVLVTNPSRTIPVMRELDISVSQRDSIGEAFW